MKMALTICKLYLIILPLALVTSSRADLLIDSFVTPQSDPGGYSANYAVGSGIIGGERDVITSLNLYVNQTVSNQLQVSYPNDLLTGTAGANITYAGVDYNPYADLFSGLGYVDLTQ